ncbi:hypothetical protein L6164_021058 [Bauhinia variegata]|uniref:Uncharacterized protein n=1 Tax=Bauhinia variegata TaxID=167791 RepID=A0ACB9MXC5_BAUVA|nr:hypothetical protein L6164_021058 [Bauhinia variegata]
MAQAGPAKLHAINSSLDPKMLNLLGKPKIADQEAWEHLRALFASRSRAQLMSLKAKLSSTTKGSESVQVYMQTLKNIANEIGLISTPVEDLDLVIYVLNGLGFDFKEI